MSLLDAVKYTISNPERRIALDGRCNSEDGEIKVRGLDQDDARLLKIASSSARQGRRVSGLRINRESALEGSGTGLARVRFPSPARRRVKAAVALWTTKELGSDVGPVEMSFIARLMWDLSVRSTWSGNFPARKPYLPPVS
jgi:hypothetical protein